MDQGQISSILPTVCFGIIFFILIVGFVVLIVYLIKKTKDSEWEGKIKDKLHKQREDFDSNITHDYYTLVVDTDEGKERKIGVSKKMFHNCKVGDTLKKEKGDLRLKKV